MKKKIFLSTDENCWYQDKIEKRILGGAENFFLLLREWLLKEGYDVYDKVLNQIDFFAVPDLTIHSNSFNPKIESKKHLLWCGSWHAQGTEHTDKTIVLSEFMKKKLGWRNAIVLPAPFNKEILKYKGGMFASRRIICTSNPNRHYPNTVKLCSILKDRQIDFDMQICGGNKLYGPSFGECFDFGNRRTDINLYYKGSLRRYELYSLLTSGNIWVYLNLNDDSETFCVSMLEAAALGIPVILPEREPFTSVLPEAFFVKSIEEMADKIEDIFENGPNRIDYDVSRYHEDVVMPKYMNIIKELLEG